MPQVQFSANIPSSPLVLIDGMTKFENWKNYFQYVKDVSVVKSIGNKFNINVIVSFELGRFSHKIPIGVDLQISDDSVSVKVVSGPLKNTTCNLKFESIDMGSKIYVNADWNVSLKYKFLIPIIKPRIKNSVIAIFYKIHTELTKIN